jgi:hypothetical protein
VDRPRPTYSRSPSMTDLTPDEKIWAFRRATNSMCNSGKRWAERVASGLTDEQLAEAIKYELGSMGGSSGPGSLSVEYAGDGLKIWAGHGTAGRHSTPPICLGPATVRLAREVYGIRDPEERQFGLF